MHLTKKNKKKCITECPINWIKSSTYYELNTFFYEKYIPLNQSKAKPHAYKIEFKFAKNVYEHANDEVHILTLEKLL